MTITAVKSRRASARPTYPHIEAVPGKRPRIAGRRVFVADVVTWYFDSGETAEDIARDYALTLAEVHAALLYYYDHRSRMDAQIGEAVARYNTAIKTPSPVSKKLSIAKRNG